MAQLPRTRIVRTITIKENVFLAAKKFIKDNPEYKSFSRLIEIALQEII